MHDRQSYEFFALDRPLTAREIIDVRALARGAEISPNHLRMESRWSGLGVDPFKLLVRYFDAMLSGDGHGGRRLMFRLPLARVCVTQLEPYFPGGPAKLARTRDQAIVDLSWHAASNDEAMETCSLRDLLPLRAALLDGDLRVAYLGWLLSVQADEVSDSAEEPPVPQGLASLTEPLLALARLLGLDAELVCAAGEGDTPETPQHPTLGGWVAGLSASEKNRWLMRALDGTEAAVGTELIAAYKTATRAASRRRTVLELRVRGSSRRAECESGGRSGCPCSARGPEAQAEP